MRVALSLNVPAALRLDDAGLHERAQAAEWHLRLGCKQVRRIVARCARVQRGKLRALARERRGGERLRRKRGAARAWRQRLRAIRRLRRAAVCARRLPSARAPGWPLLLVVRRRHRAVVKARAKRVRRLRWQRRSGRAVGRTMRRRARRRGRRARASLRAVGRLRAGYSELRVVPVRRRRRLHRASGNWLFDDPDAVVARAYPPHSAFKPSVVRIGSHNSNGPVNLQHLWLWPPAAPSACAGRTGHRALSASRRTRAVHWNDARERRARSARTALQHLPRAHDGQTESRGETRCADASCGERHDSSCERTCSAPDVLRRSVARDGDRVWHCGHA